ncbi:putative lipoprotein NMB1124/NMB1162 [Burkholderia multivorans]
MFKFLSLKLMSVLSIVALLSACVQPVKRPDYTAFRKSQPRSILVLPPINETSDVAATYGMLSQMTLPLAESGYYVVPVAVMDETFKQNGLTNAAEIQGTPPAKLREIFGADAALYSKVTQYGTVYRILASATVVSASAKLVDLRTGDVLWQGRASASNDEGGNNGGGGLIGMLVTAAVKQIANTLMDQSHDIAAYTSSRLLSAGPPAGLLYGPHSPKYGTD